MGPGTGRRDDPESAPFTMQGRGGRVSRCSRGGGRERGLGAARPGPVDAGRKQAGAGPRGFQKESPPPGHWPVRAPCRQAGRLLLSPREGPASALGQRRRGSWRAVGEAGRLLGFTLLHLAQQRCAGRGHGRFSGRMTGWNGFPLWGSLSSPERLSGRTVCVPGLAGAWAPAQCGVGVWPCVAPLLPAPLARLLAREHGGPGLLWRQTPGSPLYGNVVEVGLGVLRGGAPAVRRAEALGTWGWSGGSPGGAPSSRCVWAGQTGGCRGLLGLSSPARLSP